MLFENFVLSSNIHKTTYTDCGDWFTLRYLVQCRIRER